MSSETITEDDNDILKTQEFFINTNNNLSHDILNDYET